jgi:D-serine deaminase-like pyridoxal phosphate-dependent protein
MSNFQFSIFNFQLTTPAFLVDRQVVARNCARMREKALSSSVAFRPHVKTHKTAEIARMQHGGGRGAITVSTLAEAEFFADAGFRDITYAVPIAPEKLGRAAALGSRIDRLNLLIDDQHALRALEQFHRVESSMFDVFLKIDCGYHRAGVDPDDPDSVRLALAIARSPAVRFHGLLTHAGHSYNARSVEEIRGVAAQEADAVTRFRALIASEGVGEVVRSVGSTPTASVVDRFDDCDEVRPGNYVFYDAFQATIGACDPADCAVSVLATVIGCYPERSTLLIDAGALALSKDLGPDHIDPAFGFGRVCDEALTELPLRLIALSQEHGNVKGDPSVITRHPIGSRLRVIPNHSCLTSAMYDVYHVVEGGAVVDQWKPVRGW